MPKRTIVIQSHLKLSLHQNALVMQKENQKFKVPLEDIGCLIIDSFDCQTTSKLLAKLAEYKVAVVYCDEKHLPISVQVPLNTTTTFNSVFELQLSLSAPFKKQIWKRIIETKINNQIKCLQLLGITKTAQLEIYAKKC